MVTKDFAVKAALCAVVMGLAGGTASRFFEAPTTPPVSTYTDMPWTPTRNSIGKERPMSADDLDRQQPGPDRKAQPAPRPRPTGTQSGWSYRNCAEARAAGAAPILRGQPGYGPHMDGDGDGIACEPYRRR